MLGSVTGHMHMCVSIQSSLQMFEYLHLHPPVAMELKPRLVEETLRPHRWLW